ncbi:MAG: cytochrome b N-terminal domain-containing protein [Acidobacteriota bacterium]
MARDTTSDPKGHIVKRILGSIFPRPVVPRTDADRRRTVLEFLVLHMRPVRVRRSTVRYTHTFGLGGMSLVLIGLLMASGILLMLAYEPSPDHAFSSIRSIENEMLFGSMVRAVHHWSANILVAVAFLHLLRVFCTGAYHGPRRFNWVIGLGLLVGILAANFTGYLLPWDQLSYWAVTICTGMLGYFPVIGEWLQAFARGGSEIGRGTLVLFYSFHTTVVPVVLIVLMAFHFWRVRKARGVVSPHPRDKQEDDDSEMVLTLPNLLVRELAVGLTVVAVVMLVAALFEAPLGAPANPGMSPNPAKAPWYFMGFQELQIHLEPLIAVVILPVSGALSLMLLPYLRFDHELSGPWFLSKTGRTTGAVAAVVALIVTPLLILIDEFWLQQVGGAGWIAVAVIAALITAFTYVMKKKFNPEKAELVQALFILFLVAFAILTITGVWFRGPGMALVWPWIGG